MVAGDAIWLPHMKMSFGGDLGTPAMEKWSNTLRFHFGGTLLGAGYEPTRDQLQDMCNQLGGAVQDWMHNASANINQAAKASWVKLNWITENGTQRDLNTVVTDFAPASGQNAFAPPPWYVTQVITLRTAVSRGRAHSGRIYPPLVWPGIDGATPMGPYISAQKATDIATAAAFFINSCATRISDVVDVPAADVCHPIVVSPGSHEKGTQSISYDIVSTVVDRVPDVMHSRTKSIPRLESFEVPIVPA